MEEEAWHKWLLLAVRGDLRRRCHHQPEPRQSLAWERSGVTLKVCVGQTVSATGKLRLEEGCEEVSSPPSCSKRSQLLLRALFSWILKNTKDGERHNISGISVLK